MSEVKIYIVYYVDGSHEKTVVTIRGNLEDANKDAKEFTNNCIESGYEGFRKYRVDEVVVTKYLDWEVS